MTQGTRSVGRNVPVYHRVNTATDTLTATPLFCVCLEKPQQCSDYEELHNSIFKSGFTSLHPRCWTCFFSFWKNFSFSKNISVKHLNNCGFTYFIYANYTNLILSEENLEPPTPTDAAPVMTFICTRALPLVSGCPSLNIYGSIKSWQRTSLTVSISFDGRLCLPHTGALESMCLTREAHSPLGEMSKMSGSKCLWADWNDKNCFSCATIMSSFDRWPGRSNCQLSQTAITTPNNRADSEAAGKSQYNKQ